MLTKLLSWLPEGWFLWAALGIFATTLGFIAGWHVQAARFAVIMAQHATYVATVERNAAQAELDKALTEQAWRERIVDAEKRAKEDLAEAEKQRAVMDASDKRLRNELSSLRKQLSGASRDACAGAAAALGELFGECEQAYRELGEDAQRYIREIEKLRRGWVK